MSGRSRLEIGTYGDISTIRTGNGKVRRKRATGTATGSFAR